MGSLLDNWNLPRVTHWSDIVWLIWALQCRTAEEASALKCIFRENIVTSNTRYIMEQCFLGGYCSTQIAPITLGLVRLKSDTVRRQVL